MDIFLFEVSSCSVTPEGLALWPGLPIRRASEGAIGQLQQGSVVELDRNGHKERATMEHYFVEGLADEATGNIQFENNIIMVVICETWATVPAGTKVFLKVN